MTSFDQVWTSALDEADETGDLRPLVKLLLTQELPDWMFPELAHLFTFRRLDKAQASKAGVVDMAFHTYQESRGSGSTSMQRVDLAASKWGLSKSQRNALQNLVDGKGRPSSHYGKQKKRLSAATEYETSLRALLKR
ncbi:hypothetical protein J2R76_005805 [Bradyrhizobium sp. USDA 4532]|uniref:hypothetical protein n=1 Tax=unclassified Bradyrhizobium TaxID=2631580 RepID=UPI0020A15D56|nr:MULTISPECIES: hypothetical protein [unclassified Bradyrhizobium]MCP1829105.1 hypothetical protein [Bradyrhizobium sp. USDA 4545]MCP1922214.1 hypothetical protein [Bradyrhizobium sp. USDA 4532]